MPTVVGGFALHEAIWGRVIGVLDPHVVQFPPFGGVEAVAGADVVPKSRPARRKTPKMGRCGRGGLHFGLNGVGQGVRARRGPGSWAPLAVLTLRCAATPHSSSWTRPPHWPRNPPRNAKS